MGAHADHSPTEASDDTLTEDAPAAPAVGRVATLSSSASNPTSISTPDATRVGVASADRQRLNLLVAGDAVFSTHALPVIGAATLGRSADNDVAIDNPSISRVHARLHLDAPLRIEDLRSVNGIWVRERRLAPGEIAEIQLGEAFRLGPVTLIVQARPTAVLTRRVRSHDYFESRVEEECSRAARTKRSVVVLHVAVDAGTSASAQPLIASALREADVLAEYAPDEFEALLLDAEPDQIEVVVGRIRDTLSARRIACRIAQGVFPTDGREAPTLLRHVRALLHGDTSDPVSSPGGMIVADEKMRNLHALVTRVARGDINVLLLGETGVGKEVVAEAVHRQSRRADKPFLRLNCAAFTETLLESELFGHERGAFTGALATKQGLFEVAAGGTVFLDEVGEMAPATQSKLLRVLDERKVMRVGGVKAIDLDVRIVSATNRDLDREAERGTFRLDLLYRLNAISIMLPPLRERVAEIEPLTRHFIRRFAASRQIPPPHLSADALARLQAYAWPGNIRELRNVVERAIILCDGVELKARDLPVERMSATFTVSAPRRDGSAAPVGTAPYAAVPAPGSTSRPTMDFPAVPAPSGQADTGPVAAPRAERGEVERAPRGGDREMVMAALAACAGNQTAAAARLGVSRRTLVYWIERFDLPRPRKPGA